MPIDSVSKVKLLSLETILTQTISSECSSQTWLVVEASMIYLKWEVLAREDASSIMISVWLSKDFSEETHSWEEVEAAISESLEHLEVQHSYIPLGVEEAEVSLGIMAHK